MTFTLDTVHEDARGRVTRWDMGPEWEATFGRRVHYTASHRCHDWDGREYGVAIYPPGAKVHAGYDTEAEAIAALDTPPRWLMHQRDHARALR